MRLSFNRRKKMKKRINLRRKKKSGVCNREKTLNGHDVFNILFITSILSFKNFFFDDECFCEL